MKRLSNFAKAAVLCFVISIVMLFAISAASPREMYENGEVSDGAVTFGDVRDGIVSDVSEGDNIINGDGEGVLSDILEPSMTDAPVTTGTSEITSASQTEGTTNTATGEDSGGAAWGIIIAVIVVIAVVLIIFLLMPKRK